MAAMPRHDLIPPYDRPRERVERPVAHATPPPRERAAHARARYKRRMKWMVQVAAVTVLLRR